MAAVALGFRQGVAGGPLPAAGRAPAPVARREVFVFSSVDGRLICGGERCLVSTNQTAQAIYQTIKNVNAFFEERFGLQGIDGKGTMPPVLIEWDENNAVWQCTSQVGGAQCAWKFNNAYALQPEVVAHEYMHAIVQSFRPLNYQDQSGALNESLADVFGIAFRHWLTGQDSWRVADRDLQRHIDTRSLAGRVSAPSRDNDYGYVHYNSTLPSHVFYQVTALMRSRLFPQYGALPLAAKIWFAAFGKITHSNFSFQEFAESTMEAAASLGGDVMITQKIVDIVKESWQHVGVAVKARQVFQRIDLRPSLA